MKFDFIINFLEKIGILSKLSKRELFLKEKLKELNDNGVSIIVTDRGGWRVEFENEQARRWYYNESFKKLKDINHEK